jgi:uncharacterized protein (TIGR02246 family)
MRQSIRSLVVVFIVLATLSCTRHSTPAAEETVSTEADVAAIERLFENNEVMLSSGDLDGWIKQFTEDAVFMPPDSPVVIGKAAGREFARPSYENFDAEYSITVNEIEVVGDWAFARWSFTSEVTPKSGGDTTKRSGKEIWILKRQPDGSWRCSHIIYNYDSPPPPPTSNEG